MLRWTDDLAVGVAQIDNQHKELFQRVEALVNAMSQGKGKSEIDSTLSFLEKYVVEHFGAEEELMAKSNYPQSATHKAAHRAFAKDFSALKSELERSSSTTVAVVQVHRRVTDWLVRHIGEVDKNLGAFLKSQGMSKAA